MLLYKLTLGAAKPLTYPEEVSLRGPHSTTDGGSPCLSLFLYPKRASGKALVSVDDGPPRGVRAEGPGAPTTNMKTLMAGPGRCRSW
jgi:hypothetical protein